MRRRNAKQGETVLDEARQVTDLLAIPEEIREDALKLIGEAAGSVWTRPGLEQSTRSLATIGILVARGLHDELAIHVRLGQEQFGVSRAQICELILHAAVYAGFPAAVAAFRVTQRVFDEMDAKA